MTDSETARQRWSPLQIGVAILAVVLVIGASIPAIESKGNLAEQSAVMGNARQIITAFKIYAGDHDGLYPDSALVEPNSANEAFRLLFQEEILIDERVFAAKHSPFVPDGDIGHAPLFQKALELGENHWAIVTGLRDYSNALTPVILENPVSTAPLRWANGGFDSVKGRTWKRGKIVVAFNDSSVAMIGLTPVSDSSGLQFELPDISEWFPGSTGIPRVLDVLER